MYTMISENSKLAISLSYYYDFPFWGYFHVYVITLSSLYVG
jgi:hypothetical protein